MTVQFSEYGNLPTIPRGFEGKPHRKTWKIYPVTPARFAVLMSNKGAVAKLRRQVEALPRVRKGYNLGGFLCLQERERDNG